MDGGGGQGSAVQHVRLADQEVLSLASGSTQGVSCFGHMLTIWHKSSSAGSAGPSRPGAVRECREQRDFGYSWCRSSKGREFWLHDFVWEEKRVAYRAHGHSEPLQDPCYEGKKKKRNVSRLSLSVANSAGLRCGSGFRLQTRRGLWSKEWLQGAPILYSPRAPGRVTFHRVSQSFAEFHRCEQLVKIYKSKTTPLTPQKI